MMLKKLRNEQVLGTLIALSLLIFPNYGLSIVGISLEDLPILIVFLYLLFKNYILFKKNISLDKNWVFFIVIFSIYITFLVGNTSYFNKTNFRFIYFLLFCYLLKNYVENFEFNIISFYNPLAIVTLVNFINIFIRFNFEGTINGWIPNFTEEINLFSMGRLGGFQGSGPNVFGFIAAVSTIVYLNEVLINKYKTLNVVFLLISFITLLFSKSRGSILAFAIGVFFLLLLYKIINLKNSLVFLIIFSIFFVYFSYQNSELILKDNDRKVLLKTGIDNIEFFKGTGGGEYVYEVYKDSFKYLNLEELERNFGIDLSKISTDVYSVGFEGQGSFIYKDSLEGFKLLNKYNLISCESSYIICKSDKVKTEEFIEFYKFIFDEPNAIAEFSEIINICNLIKDSVTTRKDLACVVSNTFLKNTSSIKTFNYLDLSTFDNQYFSKLAFAKIDVPCEEDNLYACPLRELNYGELSYFLNQLIIEDFVSNENLEKKCLNCEINSIKGTLMLNFDYKDGIFPRSKIEFYVLSENNLWDQIGEEYTPGYIIELVKSNSIIEVAGWADGQSFGDSFLGAFIKSIEIKSDKFSEKIIFDIKNLNSTFSVYFPNTLNNYTSKITFNEEGIKAFNPNKYWISTNSKFDLSKEDFQIILDINLDEIPINKQVLASQSSLFNDSKHSWQWYIEDGRLFFAWADDQGVYREILGDRSYRSGILISKDGKLSSQSMVIDNNYNLNQITTSHNGFVTFSVEYGLIVTLALLVFLFLNIKQNIFKNKLHFLPTIILIMFLVQNLTNDLIYSPDASILFWMSVGILAAKKPIFQ